MFEEKKILQKFKTFKVKELVMGLTVIQKAIQYKIKSQDKKKNRKQQKLTFLIEIRFFYGTREVFRL